MTKPKITLRQKIAVINFALASVEDLHGSVTDKEHFADTSRCKCSYGEAIRGLRIIRREIYVAIEAEKVKKS